METGYIYIYILSDKWAHQVTMLTDASKTEIPRQSYTTVEIKLKQTGGGIRSRKPAVKPLRKISCCAAVCWEHGRVKGN